MNYRTVGKTGIKVSNLCFGTMSFGGNADEETSKKCSTAPAKLALTFSIQQTCTARVAPKKF